MPLHARLSDGLRRTLSTSSVGDVDRNVGTVWKVSKALVHVPAGGIVLGCGHGMHVLGAETPLRKDGENGIGVALPGVQHLSLGAQHIYQARQKPLVGSFAPKQL